MPLPTTQPFSALPAQTRYGAASRFDFDNPNKWVTVSGVPLLDEHEMTDEDGSPVAYVDRHALAEIAANNNKRVVETGDPATLILGHTSDDPRAPEKPAKGFVVNYKVKPFKRDPATGQVIYAIHGDYKLRPQNAKIVDEYPRRSVELWWNKKELDPIALLGGTTPERDLGVVIRKARLNNVVIGSSRTGTRTIGNTQADTEVIKFRQHGQWTIESYAIETPKEQKMPTPRRTPSANGHGPNRYSHNNPTRYEAFDNADPTVIDGEDEDEGGDDPLVAKVFQSKQFKSLESKLDMILQALQPEQEQGLPGEEGMEGQPGMEGEPGMEPDMEGQEGEDGMEPGMEDDGMQPEEESREEHGNNPVRFEAGVEEGQEGEDAGPFRKSVSTGFAGPGSTSVPTFGKGGKAKPTSYSRGSNNVKTNPQVVRLQRHVDNLTLKLARKDANELIQQLKSEGIVFGDTPQEAAEGERDEAEFLALLGEDDRQYHVNNVIRKRYKRKRSDPANPANPGLARYARPTDQGSADDDFEPNDSMEASEFADLLTLKKMDRAAAIKFMRNKRQRM